MLRISIPISAEAWDEEKEEFIEPKYQELELEHSLVSLSKWESKWHKAYLSKADKTDEEMLDYIKCMTLDENVDPDVYQHLTRHNILQIHEYINDPMSATVLPKDKSGRSSREKTTAELIYYWMISSGIPFECEKWHLNRLLKLIEVCNVKNSKPRQRSQREIMRERSALNASRRKQLNTRG